MMTLSRRSLAVLAAAVVGACSGDSSNDGPPPHQLFAVTYGASKLVELNPDTGAFVREIGVVGYRVNGLEYDSTTGRLFGTTSTGDGNFPDGLIEINMATGAGTPIGTGAGMLVNNPTVNAAGQMYAWTEDSDDLVTLDKTTGLATVVGDSGIGTAEHGLRFDATGTLWFVNYTGYIYTINPATGASTYRWDIGQMAHHGDFHPVTGAYWGLDTTASYGTTARNVLVVDVATGAITATLPTYDNLLAIAFK
jgi:hypothetical protein